MHHFVSVSGAARSAKQSAAAETRVAPAPRVAVEPTRDDGATSSRVTAAPPVEPAPEKPGATNPSANYELASRPVDTPVEKAVQKTFDKPVEKPVARQADKPASKEQKPARRSDTAKSRRTLDDVSEEVVRERPRLFVRRYASPIQPWRFGGHFRRHSFRRPCSRF